MRLISWTAWVPATLLLTGSAAATPKPSVRLGKAQVIGAAKRGQVEAVLKTSRDKVSACFDAAVGRQPYLRGASTLAILIGKDGKVLSVNAPAVQDVGFEGCVEGVLGSLTFTAPRDGLAVAVSVPWSWDSGVRPPKGWVPPPPPPPKPVPPPPPNLSVAMGGETISQDKRLDDKLDGKVIRSKAGGAAAEPRLGSIPSPVATAPMQSPRTGSPGGGAEGGLAMAEMASKEAPVAVEIAFEAPTVAGGDLDAAIVRRYLKRNLARFEYCYAARVGEVPTLEGRLILAFDIGADGAVSDAQALGLGDSAVEDCAERVLASIAFPAPKSGAPHVTYPVRLRPGAR